VRTQTTEVVTETDTDERKHNAGNQALSSDRQSDCKVLINMCQSVTTTQKVILQAYDGMPVSL